MGRALGVFAGSASSFNVRRLLSNIGQALSSEFTAHLISTNETVRGEVSGLYDEIHGTERADSLKGEVSALRSYLQSHDPGVLFQITSPPIHGTIVGAFSAMHGIPFVYRYSGDRFYEYRVSRGPDKPLHFGLNNVLGRVPLHLADAYVTLGPTGSRRLQARGVDRSDISIIPPIVDREKFASAGTPAESSVDRHVGLFVGRLSRKKGKETLERTLPEILERRQDLEFVFVGKQVESLDIAPQYQDHLTMVGPVPPSEIPRYFAEAKFLVHPTLTEGLPRVVLEALASGTPPIARDVGDVAYATENTFQTDSEFIEMVCDFESLTVDPVDKFLFEKVGEQYASKFSSLLGKCN